METATESNGKRSARRQRAYLGIAVALVVVVGAAWVAIDRSGGNDKSQRSGAVVTTAGEYKNVELVARITTAGVAVDASGNVYVADTNNNRVQKFASGCTSTCAGVTVVSGGRPTGVAADASGNVYVADQGNDRVQKCVPSATVWTCSTVAGGNGVGSAANQLSPGGVAVTVDGNVYVTDIPLQWELPVRIQKWAPGATEGTTVVARTESTSVENQLFLPAGVAVDTAGNLYVADYEGWVHKWSWR